MSQLPRIAVVTPSFNAATHIGATVRSVLEQDHADVDYLVMDGGSTDGTVDVLKGFGRRLRWISRPDEGQADAIRRGFEQTTGDVLAWLNADDVYAPGALRAVAEFFASHPEVALVYGDANFIDAEGSLIGACVHVEPFNRRRLSRYSDFIAQPAAFFRRSAYEAVGGLDPSLHWAMDWDLWLKLAARYEVAYLRRRLADYRWLANTKTATGGFARIEEINAMLRRHGCGPAAYVQLEEVNLRLREAAECLRRGEPGRAARQAARATATLVSSPRALWSMAQPNTWRIIWTGQVLRARAARHCPAAECDDRRLPALDPHALERGPL